MDLNIDKPALMRVAVEAGKAGLPFLEQGLTAILEGVGGPFGFLVGPALNLIYPKINAALGLAQDAPPDEVADKIAADPAAAATALDTLNSQQQFQLEQQKQADATQIAVQGQQTALLAVDATSESWWVRSWRPAAAWVCVAGLTFDVLLIPLMQWGAAWTNHTIPPAPDSTTLIGLLTAMLGLGALRTATLASKDSVKKAIVAPPKPAAVVLHK